MQATLRIYGYDSFEQIAVGGMAVVYKARKLSVKKPVAIKVLLPHLAADSRFIARFQQEAEVAAKVQHDNIVNVVDYGKADSSYYIVMEYYDGLTVEELLRNQPRLPLDVALSIVLSVCGGLEAAHAAQLVHRDIKPANVILTRQGGIKVADFGLAKSVDKFVVVTQPGKVVGTPAYMSPEQTRGEPVGTQSDLFSLGVVAFELLCGRRPFSGSSYGEVVDQIQRQEPPPISSVNPMIEPPIEAVVSRLLAKSQADRYAHASEVIMDLEALMDRYNLRRDQRTLGKFVSDPVGYTDTVNQGLLERLAGEAPAGNPRNRARDPAILHYRKVLYLDPGDEGAKASLAKLGAPVVSEEAPVAAGTTPTRRTPAKAAPAADPNAEYLVILQSIDPNVETAETFALKLSMRLKSPLPRMRSLVSRAPCVIVQRIPYKKARWLISVVEELGGTARLEVIDDRVPVTDAPNMEPTLRSDPAGKTAERRSVSGGILCPRCGWEEEPDARFCSICLRLFDKTDKIDVPGMHSGFANPSENPLDQPPGASPRTAARPWHRLPLRRALFVGIPALLVIAAVLILVLR
jgi:serine/threonine protein kinase